MCGPLGARRLGHLAVLNAHARPDGATKLRCVVGPCWPFTALVTLPLILGIETAAAVFLVPRTPGWLVAVWALCLAVLLGGLAGTSCRDPGVLRRQREAPPAEDGKEVWRWSDQAQTYRPPSAQYDADCGVVIEGFDHVCPWTGTAIGKRNMCAFKTFTSCLLVNIIVLSALAAFGVRAGLRSRYDPSSTESEGADDAAE